MKKNIFMVLALLVLLVPVLQACGKKPSRLDYPSASIAR